MIVVHLDGLSVVSHAIATPEEPLSPAIREEIELFSQTVTPPLYAHISESPLNIIIGLLALFWIARIFTLSLEARLASLYLLFSSLGQSS